MRFNCISLYRDRVEIFLLSNTNGVHYGKNTTGVENVIGDLENSKTGSGGAFLLHRLTNYEIIVLMDH